MIYIFFYLILTLKISSFANYLSLFTRHSSNSSLIYWRDLDSPTFNHWTRKTVYSKIEKVHDDLRYVAGLWLCVYTCIVLGCHSVNKIHVYMQCPFFLHKNYHNNNTNNINSSHAPRCKPYTVCLICPVFSLLFDVALKVTLYCQDLVTIYVSHGNFSV